MTTKTRNCPARYDGEPCDHRAGHDGRHMAVRMTGKRGYWSDADHSAAPKVGDVVRVRKTVYTGLIEVDYVDDVIVEGRIPYATTYTEGGKYEGAYRGRQSAWLTEVESIERSAR